MIRNQSGVWGEVFAARFLRENGYKIITRNYYCRFGELDVVASKKGTLCIIEVKARNKNTDIRPMEAVDYFKQERIRMATKSFLSFADIKANVRFDVCEVYLDDNLALSGINYIKNAFR